MQTMIPTETVQLYVKTKSGTDAFGQDEYTESLINVSGVIVGEPSTTDIENELTLYGKRLSYMLGIPVNDTNTWEDTIVIIRNKKFHTLGNVLEYTPGGMPSWWQWDKKIGVEAYE